MRYPLSTTLLSEAALPKHYTAALYGICRWCYLHLGLLQSRLISSSGIFTSRNSLFIVGLLLFVLVTKWYRISCMLKTQRKKWSTSDSLPLRLFHFELICYRPAGRPVYQVKVSAHLMACSLCQVVLFHKHDNPILKVKHNISYVSSQVPLSPGDKV